LKKTREQFVECYLVLYQKELLDKLPESGCTTVMLHKAGTIINDLNTHLIASIHDNIKKED